MVGLSVFAFVIAGGSLAWFLLNEPKESRLPEKNEPQSLAPESSEVLAVPVNSAPIDSPAITPGPLEQASDWKHQAVSAAREVVETYPDDAVSYALLGSAYFNIGQSTEAVENLRHCIELDPKQSEAYEILARISYDKGDLEETIHLCEVGLENGGGSPALLIHLGQALLDLGRSEEAIHTLSQTDQIRNRSSEGSYLLGQAYLQAGDFARAIESFRVTTELRPDHTQAFFGLFTASMRLGLSEEAKVYREQFLKLEGIDRKMLSERSAQEDTLSGLPLVRETVARTLFGAGQIYNHHGQTEKAKDLFLKAATIDPDNALPRAALVSLLTEQNGMLEAVKTFERLAANHPESSLDYLFLGRLHEQSNHFESAEEAYRQVIKLAPDRPDGYRSLIELYFRSDRKHAEAKGLARQLLELEPESGPNHYLVAFACIRTNDRAGAVAAMEEAVRLSPENQRFQTFLNQLKKTPSSSSK